MSIRLARVGPEEALLKQVLALARLRGWRVAHFRPGMTKHGWRTAMTGAVGFPDLILARDGRIILAELKAPLGRLTPSQRAWLHALGWPAAPHVFIWRLTDWPRIEAALL